MSITFLASGIQIYNSLHIVKIGRNKPPFEIDDAKYDFHDFTGITEKDLLDWWLDESISENRSS